MKQFIDDIFVGTYHYLSKVEGVGNQVSFWHAISTIITIVGTEALIVASIILNIDKEYIFIETKSDGLLLGASLFFLHFMLFMWGNRYKKILGDFYLDIANSSKRVERASLVFVSLSVIVFVVSLVRAIIAV